MANTAPFSNNAPPPIPGYGNPTGIAAGKTGAASASTPFPFLPTYGAPQYNTGPYNATNIGSLSSGFGAGALPQNLLKELQDAYGKGEGSVLDQILTKGLFNPQIASAFLNAQQPGINRGEADILGAFGNEGARFGSAASIGFGDYLSQVQLNQQQTLASLFQQDQAEQLSLLQGILPTLHDENVNRESSGIIGDILGGLETVGGVAAAFVPGLQGLAAPLISGGIGTIAGANGQSSSSSGGGGTQDLGKLIAGLLKKSQTGPGGQTAGQGSTAATIPSSTGTLDELNQITLSTQAGTVFGGTDPFANGGTGGDESQLLQFLMSQGLLSPDQLLKQDGLGGN